MFDPAGLRHRYKTLSGWDGQWVNYWTITTGFRNVMAHHLAQSLVALGNDQFDDVTKGREERREKREEKRLETENAMVLITSGVVEPRDLQAYTESRPESPASSYSRSPSPSPSASSLSLPLPSISLSSPPSHSLSLPVPAQGDYKRHSKHHFITLPLYFGPHSPNWVRVSIAGAADEVEAHTGIFMRDRNLDYEEFVGKVGLWLKDLCVSLAK
jgi:hypothetical protein